MLFMKSEVNEDEKIGISIASVPKKRAECGKRNESGMEEGPNNR